MPLFAAKTKEKEINKVIEVHIGFIKPNPHQPRKRFGTNELTSLAKSISNEGILQPLSVRKLGENNYQLISGERRLRAARIAGLKYVPCIVMGVTERNSALFALIENIQREDLDFFEEAEAISEMIDCYGMTQEDAAIRLGMAQSTVANKLRLLKLSAGERQIIGNLGLTERHARALLRIPDYETRLEVLEKIARGSLTVEKTESYIENLLEGKRSGDNVRKNAVVLRDIRLFMNTISKAVEIVQAAGVQVDSRKIENDSGIQLLITIPREESSCGAPPRTPEVKV